ncbi:FecR domain-containing protein [Arenibacter sp. F26102]|uniref:FecR family protein n=1 Tax=Arenibacter sp. F26102 TaxID=2926416 RepID=UPI001FF419C9|nr:FecR domain-containing protein [Arenibacter sp. F26102]MCK0147229.1 FecR domain-containing protein [Arenibacter sp. F26102]
MQEDLLQKYLENKLGPEEKELVFRWIKKGGGNQKKFNVLKAKHVAGALKSISREEPVSAFNIFQKKRNLKRLYRSLSYAAIVVLLISISFTFYKDHFNIQQKNSSNANQDILIAHSENGAKKKIILPDGSTVILNIDSYIEYPINFKKETREVSLIGEATFDIVHDSLRPFIVMTEHYNVKVLGTTFNVKSYPNDTQTETTLITGKVELVREKEEPIILAPSQQAVFNKAKNKIKIGKVISEDVVAWQKGTLVFKNTPMQQVALDLERNHNKKIIIKSSKLLEYEYTGTLDNLSLEESLQLLKVSSPIDFKILKYEIILNMKE